MMYGIFSLLCRIYFFIILKINYVILKLSGVHLGEDVSCYSIKSISSPKKLFISNRTWIGSNVSLYAENCIKIGSNCMIAKDVSIISVDHLFEKSTIPYIDQGYDISNNPIFIGNNVWIGEKAIILKGVSIGDNSIIGAGSVVTKSIPRNTVVAGNPAKIIKLL